MKEFKKNRQLIRHHITELKKGSLLPESEKFWPDFLYHFTDIKNAIKILNDDRRLYSRNYLERNQEIPTDSACNNIIANTKINYKEYVRLYFRPRTPTQYCNEGIRTARELPYPDAHCPVPIFFIFNALPILSSQETSFSNGNLRSNDAVVDNSVEFYLNLPFEKIFHNKWLPNNDDEEKKTIKFHRQAEVMVPNQLELDDLNFICCRSIAEFQTLLNSLNPEAANRFRNRISLSGKFNLFFSRWHYIKKVSMSSKKISIKFNPPETHSSINMKCNITSPKYSINRSREDTLGTSIDNNQSLEFNLESIGNPREYEFTIWLDGNLAFQNYYNEDQNEPF